MTRWRPGVRLRADGVPPHVVAARRYLEIVRREDGVTARADAQEKITRAWYAKINWKVGPDSAEDDEN